MRRLLPATLIIVAVGAAAVLLWGPIPPTVQRSASRDDQGNPSASRGDDARAPVVAALPDLPPAAPPRPRSLRGTRTDGGLVTDGEGRFVPTLDARRLFDYVLTGSGELPPDALRDRIEHEIARRLAPAAAKDATALLERYLAYRERVRLLASEDDGGDLDARLATLIALRREMLGSEAAEAFFAEEEADARRLLELRRLANDPTLTVAERARHIAAIEAHYEAGLAPEAREARRAARVATSLRAAEEELRARGGDAAELQALREEIVGPEAAARLGDLDRRRAEWQTRVDAYRNARDRIASDTTLAPDERAAAVARLREESFSEPERLRVDALDTIAADE
jgi:lipase chaperone LimK